MEIIKDGSLRDWIFPPDYPERIIHIVEKAAGDRRRQAIQESNSN